VKRVPRIERRARHPGLKLEDLLRKVFGVVRVRIEREGRALIRSRRAAQTQIDAPRRDRFERSQRSPP
jgi:hypothetical protein